MFAYSCSAERDDLLGGYDERGRAPSSSRGYNRDELGMKLFKTQVTCSRWCGQSRISAKAERRYGR